MEINKLKQAILKLRDYVQDNRNSIERLNSDMTSLEEFKISIQENICKQLSKYENDHNQKILDLNNTINILKIQLENVIKSNNVNNNEILVLD